MKPSWPASAVRDLEEDRERFSHVARHLYRHEERWEQVVPDLGDARARAWDKGCAPAILEAPHPDCDRASASCRSHVLRDHDELLAPAYRRELHCAEASERVGQLHQGPRGWACVGDAGVYVVVREVGPERVPQVKSAYRIIPKQGEGRRPVDFLKAAVRRLSDKTSWTSGDD